MAFIREQDFLISILLKLMEHTKTPKFELLVSDIMNNKDLLAITTCDRRGTILFTHPRLVMEEKEYTDYVIIDENNVPEQQPTDLCPWCNGNKVVFNSYDERKCEVCNGTGAIKQIGTKDAPL